MRVHQPEDEPASTVGGAPGLPRDQDPGLDAAMLRRLFVLAGPDVALLLRTSLAADLAEARDGLAAPGADTARLRRHAHVLIALAGTAGASCLCEAARALHGELARDGDAAPLVRAILPMTDTLIRTVAAFPLPGAAPR